MLNNSFLTESEDKFSLDKDTPVRVKFPQAFLLQQHKDDRNKYDWEAATRDSCKDDGAGQSTIIGCYYL